MNKNFLCLTFWWSFGDNLRWCVLHLKEDLYNLRVIDYYQFAAAVIRSVSSGKAPPAPSCCYRNRRSCIPKQDKKQFDITGMIKTNLLIRESYGTWSHSVNREKIRRWNHKTMMIHSDLTISFLYVLYYTKLQDERMSFLTSHIFF